MICPGKEIKSWFIYIILFHPFYFLQSAGQTYLFNCHLHKTNINFANTSGEKEALEYSLLSLLL